ncbi:PREDICTED: U3 small nucleolar ribonucleoprotein protein MPP10 [Ceratosolen solmsi marchali]|uniref:U3 small nucleolar ribonucleoprotein protein MPP10 n=1 Tax=Ceratosolen solmsi marchali TaxID=326594 RepID=A0AAJ6VKR8_9HYME|nr:PREDICTED: U3 small nucleolar ribonucleoprotein protein MPP10 [Ceratosolen solmsi marchali]
MVNDDLILLDEIQQTIQNCTKDPQAFLSVQENLYEDLKNATKQLYDLSFKIKSLSYPNSKALPELIVKDLDTEQIWQQIEFANNELLSPSRLAEISKILNSKESLKIPLEFEKALNKNNSSNDESEEQNEILTDKNGESTDDNEEEKASSNTKKKRKTTEVDDKFFKLDDLNEYLKKEDKKEMTITRNKNTSSDDEESIDLFNHFSDVADEEDEDVIETKRRIKYADFFDKPESDNESQGGRNENDSEKDYNSASDDTDDIDYKTKIEQMKYERDKKKVKFDLSNETDETDSDERATMKTDENKNTDESIKSSLETRQERLKKRIKELEEKAVAEKPWQLKGEINALTRPQNSLLQEYVEFDSASRPAPIITEQTTMKLEDIIRGRVKDKAWDDVEKKFKPVDTPMEYKKKLIMNQEKSKESLAQIYENEYIKQREGLNSNDKEEQEEKEPQEHIEIKERIHDIFTKLDALSNFHYTPKLAKPEIKIISNLPAINMEEVAPVAISDATLLAPEEIHTKQKGDPIGKSERSRTDMKRERRKKKLKQRARAMNESKKVAENHRLNKSTKKLAILGKLKGRNIIDMSNETNQILDKSIKSSTTFFAHLQDQAQSAIKQKVNENVKKKNKNTLSAVRLKL